MITVSSIRAYLGKERFDAAMEAARKEREAQQSLPRQSEVGDMENEGKNKGLTIEKAADVLKQSTKFKFNLPRIQPSSKSK
jgi:hypothetical protein